MNLRDIKKDIEYLIGEFIDDCSLFITLNPKKGTEKVSPIVDEAVDLYNDLKYKINHPAEGARKAYYDNLRREMLERLDALSEKLSAVISTEEYAAPGRRLRCRRVGSKSGVDLEPTLLQHSHPVPIPGHRAPLSASGKKSAGFLI